MDGKELKRYNEIKGQMQHYRARCYTLEQDLLIVGPQAYHAQQKVNELQKRVDALVEENRVLKTRLDELLAKFDHQPKPKTVPAFVKPNVEKAGKKRPGRKAGHEAALRPMPENIDAHIDVPAPADSTGTPSCPHCHVQLSDVRKQDRIVEDIVPSKVVVTCYHTLSGYCPGCRKRIETRAPEQPPPSDVPQAMIGINALATAAMMRVQYRLPYRLITQLMSDLPGLSVSPGALARQIERMGRWLEGEYDRLKIFLRHSPAVNMDETSWRVDGDNQWLWAMLDKSHTLYHVDKSRGSQVVRELLGEVFGGILASDFYSAYGLMDCRKQKCLAHLLRELKETAIKSPAFGVHPFHRRLKRLIKELLALRKKREEIEPAKYQEKGRLLETRLNDLAGGTHADENATRLARRLKKHAGELTLFLWEAGVEPTNNAAERALRPAVVMRKITGGSRSERGARATVVLMSVVKTIKQQNRPLFETIKTLLMNAWAGENPGLLTDAIGNST
jgi:transposase